VAPARGVHQARYRLAPAAPGGVARGRPTRPKSLSSTSARRARGASSRLQPRETQGGHQGDPRARRADQTNRLGAVTQATEAHHVGHDRTASGGHGDPAPSASTSRKTHWPIPADASPRRGGRPRNSSTIGRRGAARDEPGAVALLGDRARLAHLRGQTERPSAVQDRDRRRLLTSGTPGARRHRPGRPTHHTASTTTKEPPVRLIGERPPIGMTGR
jgi:hypothetical protein